VSCSEAEVVDGVVRNRERMKIYFADAKIFARFDFFYSIAEGFGAASRFVVADVLFFTNVSIERLPGDINRTIDRIEENTQTAGVIAMFVCDKHCIEALRVFADHRETARDLFCTQAGVDKNARVTGNDQDGVTS
jgi:hypothetical protein